MNRAGTYALVGVEWALVAAWCSFAARHLLAVHYGTPPQAATTLVAAGVLASAAAVVGLLACREPWRSRAHVTATTVLVCWLLAAVADATTRLNPDPAAIAVAVAVAVPAVAAAASWAVLHLARLGARRQVRDHVTNHVLYRFYDESERLLYVGITNDPRARFFQHRASKDWWGDIAVRELTYWPSREALEEAEREAIRVEDPVHNEIRYTSDNRVGAW